MAVLRWNNIPQPSGILSREVHPSSLRPRPFGAIVMVTRPGGSADGRTLPAATAVRRPGVRGPNAWTGIADGGRRRRSEERRVGKEGRAGWGPEREEEEGGGSRSRGRRRERRHK